MRTVAEAQQQVPGRAEEQVRVPWTLADALCVALPFAFLVAIGGPLFLLSSFTPRMSLLLAAGVPGTFVLAGLARLRDSAAVAAAVLLGWVVVAACFSGAPRLAFRGSVTRESSGLILILALGVWAVGRRASQRAVRIVPLSVLVGVGANIAVGLLQVALQVQTGPLALQGGRVTGLTPNPVYFGAIAAAGAALATSLPASSIRWRAAFVVVCAAGANLSGSRVALLAGLLVIMLLVARMAPPRLPGLVFPVAYASGILAVWLTSMFINVSPTTARAGASGGGRLDAWHYGLEAAADRPLFGWGLGRFRAAIQARFDAEFVRRAALDDLRSPWFDAHNLLIELAVGIGVVGLAVFAAWLYLAARNVGGPLVAPLLVFSLIMLVQPAGLAIAPVALFLVGCAERGTARPMRLSSLRPSVAVLFLIGLLLAASLVLGDLRLKAAVERRNPSAAAGAARLFPADPVVADVVAQLWLAGAVDSPSDLEHAEAWSRRAVDAEPDRPLYRSRLADILLLREDLEGSILEANAGLKLQPWHARSLAVLYLAAGRAEDADQMDLALTRLCVLLPNLEICTPQPDPP